MILFELKKIFRPVILIILLLIIGFECFAVITYKEDYSFDLAEYKRYSDLLENMDFQKTWEYLEAE